MKKTFHITFLLIFLTLVTVFVSIQKPSMHKQAIITDSNYVFVEDKGSFSNITASNVDLKSPKVVASVNSVGIINDNQSNINIVEKQTTKPKINLVEPSKNVQNVKAPVVLNKNSHVTAKQTVQSKTVEQNKKNEIALQNQNVEIKTETKTPVVEDTQSTKETLSTPVPTKKVLTESEEIIAWNKWRSDLQNQVMRDTKIGAPIGTGFRFSFTVDKYGNMSNIKVWSTNPVYTDLAVRVIKPILNSYSKKPILSFPEGTKRVITNVTGGFVISTKTEYSTPSDYSDYERVKRTQYN